MAFADDIRAESGCGGDNCPVCNSGAWRIDGTCDDCGFIDPGSGSAVDYAHDKSNAELYGVDLFSFDMDLGYFVTRIEAENAIIERRINDLAQLVCDSTALHLAFVSRTRA